MPVITASAGNASKPLRRVLIIVQNLPVPFDRRVWNEAMTLVENGYQVCIISPKGRGYDEANECLNGVHIYRHPAPPEAHGAFGYFIEYMLSLFWEYILAWRIYFKYGFDAIHACNPPDNIFLIAAVFKALFGTRFLFDHHDINPELYEAKFGRRDFFYKIICGWERLTFKLADISIATNNSYRDIAIQRGSMKAENVFVVRSGPDLARMLIKPAIPTLKHGKPYLIGYVGVMGKQEGIAYLIEVARHIVYDLNRTDIHFTLIGDGPERTALQNLTSERRLGDYVNFTGRVSDDAMLDILNTADICVNPDEVNAMNDKSTMNKIMEYMALGKPIVQFDVTEGRFSALGASLYARPNDAQDFAVKIIELIDDPAKRAVMGCIGRARIENELAWKFEAPKLLAAYDALFKREAA
jgi:glycosyltransferase involved in cell wall biosynthesis